MTEKEQTIRNQNDQTMLDINKTKEIDFGLKHTDKIAQANENKLEKISITLKRKIRKMQKKNKLKKKKDLNGHEKN